MKNGIMNKIKSLFNRKKNENKKEEIKVEKQKYDSTQIEDKEIKHKIQEKKTPIINHSKENKVDNSQNAYKSHENRKKYHEDGKRTSENRIKNTRKNDTSYNSKHQNKKTYNTKKHDDKKHYERKIHDNKAINSKYNSNNGKRDIDKKSHISHIENLIKDITVGMEFKSDSFKGEILKKQSSNLIYCTENGEEYSLTYKELIEGYVQRGKTGSIDEKWYQANFNKNIGSSNLTMIGAILKKYTKA